MTHKPICWSPQPLWGVPKALPEDWQWVFGHLPPENYPLVTGLIVNGSDGYFDATRMAEWPQLRVISSYGIGYDHINVADATSRNIVVTHTPDVVTQSTAEMAMALTLALVRNLLVYDRQTRKEGRVLTGSNTALSPELYDKRVGLIGYGRTGQTIAKLLTPFGVTIQYTRAHGPHPANPQGYATLNQLLATSDVVIVIIPATPETYHLLGAHQLAMMPRGSYLVNVGRGPVIDESALVDALNRGHLAGAALDVYENEPLVHPGLLQRADVVLSPHRGTSTFETRQRMTETAIDNLVQALQHHPVRIVPEQCQGS
ncbi:MAG: D-glycerate dehydrogenase [Sulfobacillus benefaciens]|uniref:D-glycerate dehydrogenase n=1 Tax=Sulfobacillus benefaciens TaxID=453960 RepID=A0A2T2XGB7_9FIRM|nr:MAG: D-glycerate dehydrogenase [Sulfobacillus benefaciens]